MSVICLSCMIYMIRSAWCACIICMVCVHACVKLCIIISLWSILKVKIFFTHTQTYTQDTHKTHTYRKQTHTYTHARALLSCSHTSTSTHYNLWTRCTCIPVPSVPSPPVILVVWRAPWRSSAPIRSCSHATSSVPVGNICVCTYVYAHACRV